VKVSPGLDTSGTVLLDVGPLPRSTPKGGGLISLLLQSEAASPTDDHPDAPAVMRPCRAGKNGFGP
jgi:hypothetical protein